VLDYHPSTGFDLVLDSGCLHHLPSSALAAYRARLHRWLLSGGDYVLVHFGKRHPLDWRPIGPMRRPREAITTLFSSLRLALPVGPNALGRAGWMSCAGTGEWSLNAKSQRRKDAKRRE